MQCIRVLLPCAPGSIDVHVPLPPPHAAADEAPLYAVIRAVNDASGIAPELQRFVLEPASAVALPLCYRVQVRQRAPSMRLVLAPFVGDAIELRVDPSDTVLDVRFLLAKVTGLPPDAHCLSAAHVGGGGALPSAAPVAEIAAHPLRLWFEVRQSTPGYGKAHRSVPKLVQSDEAHTHTLQAMFRWATSEFGERRLLGVREWRADGTRGQYVWHTFRQVSDRVTSFGSGLRQLGMAEGAKLGILGVNRPEWAIADWTCMCYGFVSVTLYETLGPNVVQYIVNQAEVQAIVVERSKLPLVTAVVSECPSLRLIIVMDDAAPDRDFFAQPQGAAAGHTHRMSEVEALGAQQPLADAAITSDQLASICYTSGTTGNPKGAMITHANLASATVALNLHFADVITEPTATIISYLPLAHIYERLAHISSLSRGVGIGYFQGDLTKLVDDVVELAPTYFPGVPKVWQRIADRIQSEVKHGSFIKRKIFEYAYQSKLAALQAGDTSPDIWNKLVFSKIAQKFGGNMQVMVSGSAPISSDVATFLKICFQCEFAEGYGLTETCASATLTPLGEIALGHVGVPTASMEVMLVDVPDMNYLNSDQPCPRGEIWLRGHSTFKGYFKMPEATSECMTEDGWFMTGDIGMWREDGRLQIIDRKKNIFKLAQGEYIRPEYIENVYKQSRFIANVFVHGDSLRQFLVAIVVPDFDVLCHWANEHEISSDPNHLVDNPRVNVLLANEIQRIGTREGLHGFEQVRRFKAITEDFTVESGLLTPSMKLKRHHAKEHFKKEIAALYREGESKL